MNRIPSDVERCDPVPPKTGIDLAAAQPGVGLLTGTGSTRAFGFAGNMFATVGTDTESTSPGLDL